MAILEYFPLPSPFKREASLDFPDEINEQTTSTEKQQIPACELASNRLIRTLDIAKQYEDQIITPEQQATLNEIITEDATAFIATILPEETLENLSINPLNHNETAIELPAPSLSDVYLLAQAYDATKDDTIKLSLEYILYDTPPALSDFLEEAYKASIKNNTSLMSEYLAIDARRSGREDTGNLHRVEQ